jgi:hypothetical protein
MSIETRLKKLEGPGYGNGHEPFDFIFLVGIKSRLSEDYYPDKAGKLAALCLRPDCDFREHESLPGETVDQMAARLRIEHSEGA